MGHFVHSSNALANQGGTNGRLDNLNSACTDMEKTCVVHISYLFQAFFESFLDMVDLVNPLREFQVDCDSLLLDVLPGLLQNTADDSPEGTGGIASLLCLQDVFIGEGAPLVRSDRAGEREGGMISKLFCTQDNDV